MELKLTTVGNSVGVILPKDLLARMRLQKGDVVYASETPEGFVLRPYDPDFSEKMAVAEEIMHKDRELLHRLSDA